MMDPGHAPSYDRDDDFNPEDVFKLFPTSFQVVPDVPIAPETTTIDTAEPEVSSLGFNSSYILADSWIFGETEDRIILPLLLALIGFCAVFGNGLVITAIIGLRRMRTGPNLMLLNMTVSDLVFILFTVPTAIINHATLGGVMDKAALGVCKFVHYIIFVSIYVSIYTLVVTCVFRFFSDCPAAGHRVSGTLLSRGNAILSSAVIWLAFLTSHLPLVLRRDGAVFQEPFICIHTIVLSEQSRMQTLWVTFLTCAFLLPLLTICSLSPAILRWQRNRKCSMHDGSLTERRQSREMTLVVMACMVARVVCWIPLQVFIMVDIFAVSGVSEAYRKAEMLAVCMAILGSTINPLLLNCVSLQMKQAFRQIMGGGGPRYLEPSFVGKSRENQSDMNETIMSIIADSTNHINYH